MKGPGLSCFLLATCFVVSLAVDSLEYIALKRIEKHKKPRIIQVPIYTIKQHIQPTIQVIGPKFPVYVPV